MLVPLLWIGIYPACQRFREVGYPQWMELCEGAVLHWWRGVCRPERIVASLNRPV